jgi:hypothetical protein
VLLLQVWKWWHQLHVGAVLLLLWQQAWQCE